MRKIGGKRGFSPDFPSPPPHHQPHYFYFLSSYNTPFPRPPPFHPVLPHSPSLSRVSPRFALFCLVFRSGGEWFGVAPVSSQAGGRGTQPGASTYRDGGSFAVGPPGHGQSLWTRGPHRRPKGLDRSPSLCRPAESKGRNTRPSSFPCPPRSPCPMPHDRMTLLPPPSHPAHPAHLCPLVCSLLRLGGGGVARAA